MLPIYSSPSPVKTTRATIPSANLPSQNVGQVTVSATGYLTKEDAQYLNEGFQLGFWISFQGIRWLVLSGNLKLVCGLKHMVQETIPKEVASSRVMGPFKAPPAPGLRLSPLGLVTPVIIWMIIYSQEQQVLVVCWSHVSGTLV